jgi:hypothetical protein
MIQQAGTKRLLAVVSSGCKIGIDVLAETIRFRTPPGLACGVDRGGRVLANHQRGYAVLFRNDCPRKF